MLAPFCLDLSGKFKLARPTEEDAEEVREAFKYWREAVDICALHRKADNLYYLMSQVYKESIKGFCVNPPLEEPPSELALLIQIDRLRTNLGAVPLAPPMEAIGLAIAYLKRGLEAVSAAIELSAQLESTGTMESKDFKRLLRRLFSFKASIINHMGDLRKERRV
jgi:hypothetical protein